LQDNSDRIWIGGTAGINIIDFKKATISHLWKDQGLDSSSPIPALLLDREGKVWMGTENGMAYSFDEKLGLLEKFHVADGPNVIYNLLEDKKGQIWMGTITGGCYFINPLQGRFGNFTETEGLGSNGVWSILEDLNGQIWIGTVNGIDVYDPASKTIKHIGKAQGLLDDRTTVLYQDRRGQIWARWKWFGYKHY
jgi:ligand-binding sensor domain-containing protein